DAIGAPERTKPVFDEDALVVTALLAFALLCHVLRAQHNALGHNRRAGFDSSTRQSPCAAKFACVWSGASSRREGDAGSQPRARCISAAQPSASSQERFTLAAPNRACGTASSSSRASTSASTSPSTP